MRAKQQTQLTHWRSLGKLAIPIGIGLLLLMVWMLGAHTTLPGRAATSTLYVDGASGTNGGSNNCLDSTNPCASIGHALSQAGEGDNILVAEGTYTGTFNIAMTVTLKGGYDASDWSRDIETHLTEIDANGAAAPVFHITPNSDFTIEGFTVEGSDNSAGTGGGFLINDATVLISATIIQDNEADNGGGVWVEGENADVWIQNSTLRNNHVEHNGGGLHNNNFGKLTLFNSVVEGNTAPDGGGGIWAADITISGSQVLSNTSAFGGAGISGHHAYIYKSQVSHNVASAGDHIYGGGINISLGSLHLEESDVTNNRAVSTGTLGISGGSAIVVNEADTTILNSFISDNKDGGNTIAVFSSPFTFTNVMLVNNDGDGIASDDVAITGTLTNVTIAGNGAQGISMNEDPATDVTVTNSILWNNGDIDNNCGTSCSITHSIIGTGDTSGEGNLSTDPQFVDPASGDYHLQAWSLAIDSGTDVGAPDVDFEGDSRPQNDGYDMGADEFVGTPIKSSGYRYVATTGSDTSNPCVEPDQPCQTVAHALDVAQEDESVLIAAGTYTENLEVIKPLTIRGGYTISGTEWLTGTGETVIDGNDAGRVFFIHGNDSTLEHLTITSGKASDPDCWGGGLWVTNGDVTLRQVAITNNQAGCAGGAIELNDDFGSASLTIKDSLITDNKVINGSGGAMNTYQNVTASLTNVLITGNQSGVGGVFSLNGGDVMVMNSTIADNQADQGILLWSGTLTMTNSIMFENALSFQGDPPCTDCFVVTYSNIQGGWTGTGNMDEDPMFVDATNGDYSLMFGSPSIDTGTESGPDHDLSGTERPLDGDGDGAKTTDMGAYEFLLYQLYLPYTLKETGP